MQSIMKYYQGKLLAECGYGPTGESDRLARLVERWPANRQTKVIFKSWVDKNSSHFQQAYLGYERPEGKPVKVIFKLPKCGTASLAETRAVKLFVTWLEKDANTAVKHVERELERISRVPEDWTGEETKKTNRFIATVGHIHVCADQFLIADWSDKQKTHLIEHFKKGGTALQIHVDLRDRVTGHVVTAESSLSEPYSYWPSPIAVLQKAIAEMRQLNSVPKLLAA